MTASTSRAYPGCRVRIAEAAFWLGVLAITPPAAAAVPADSLLGTYMTEDRQGVVRIEPCGDAYCGRVVGISDFPPGGLRDLHGTPQCGLVILHDLRAGDDGRRHGSITNPDDGKTYSAIVWVAEDGDMRLRGYVGLPLFGSTQHWPAFRGHLTPDCHFSR